VGCGCGWLLVGSVLGVACVGGGTGHDVTSSRSQSILHPLPTPVYSVKALPSVITTPNASTPNPQSTAPPPPQKINRPETEPQINAPHPPPPTPKNINRPSGARLKPRSSLCRARRRAATCAPSRATFPPASWGSTPQRTLRWASTALQCLYHIGCAPTVSTHPIPHDFFRPFDRLVVFSGPDITSWCPWVVWGRVAADSNYPSFPAALLILPPTPTPNLQNGMLNTTRPSTSSPACSCLTPRAASPSTRRSGTPGWRRCTTPRTSRWPRPPSPLRRLRWGAA